MLNADLCTAILRNFTQNRTINNKSYDITSFMLPSTVWQSLHLRSPVRCDNHCESFHAT